MNKEYYHQRLVNYIRLSGYSINTLTVYRSTLDLILAHITDPPNTSILQLQEFAAKFKNDNTRKNICVVLRWLYIKVLGINIEWYELPYPKKKLKVQPVYQHEDIVKVMDVTTSLKQKAILALMIDCGLRISEPCTIYLKDCNSKARSIILRSAKGDNDRVIYPSVYVWQRIKEYWHHQKIKPEKYLFEGDKKNMPYTTTSIRMFLKRSCRKVNVKYLGAHAIRRHTGTWLVENNTPLTLAANILGHKSVKTLEKHYVIHSPSYMKSIATPLAAR